MSIAASLLREYCFCPRVVFFQYILGIKIPLPLWVKQGVDYHQRETILSQSRTLNRYKLTQGSLQFDVALKSEKEGIHGIADALIFNQQYLLVVEFKLNCIKPMKGQILQMTAYALMAQEQFGIKSTHGFISYGTKGKVHKIEITEQSKKQLRAALSHIHQMQSTQIMPDSSASNAQCEQCGYINFCNDRD